MFESYKGRSVSKGDRVFVYRNLHNGRWSMKAETGKYAGLVVAHADSVALRFAEFKVSEAGRQRVLREKRKNVHAGISGEYVGDLFPQGLPANIVRYNPYEAGTFTCQGRPVLSARRVELDKRGKVFVG